MATYYVAQSDGSDSYDGLYPSYQGGTNGPWLTITYAATQLAAGDTLYIRTGTYSEYCSFNSNGTAVNRITIDTYQSEAVTIDGEYTKPSSVFLPLVRAYGDYITIRDLKITRSYGASLFLQGDYCEALNITGDHSYASGIVDLGAHNTIDYCTHTTCGEGYPSPSPTWGAAISTQGSYGTIKHCIAWDNIGEGLSFVNTASHCVIEDSVSYNNESYNFYIDSGDNCVCRRNLVYQTTPSLETAGIVVAKEYSGTVFNIEIYNNLVMGCRNNFHVATDVTGLAVYHNTFVNSTGTSGYDMGVYIKNYTYSNCVFKNNITIEESESRVPITILNATGWTFDYNCWNKTPVAAAQGAYDYVGDPRLAKVGPTTPGNLSYTYFELRYDSPVIDIGTDVDIDTDYLGNPRA